MPNSWLIEKTPDLKPPHPSFKLPPPPLKRLQRPIALHLVPQLLVPQPRE